MQATLDLVVAPRPAADLLVVGTAAYERPEVGSENVFTAYVENRDTTTASTGITVTFEIGPGWNVTDLGGGAYDAATRTATWSDRTLAAGGSAYFQFVAIATLAIPLEPTGEYVATATAATFDPDQSNNTSAVIVDPLDADIGVTVGADDTTPAVGDTITVTAGITHAGNDDITVLLEVGVPVALTPGSISGTGHFDSESRVVRWLVPETAVGGAGPFTYAAVVGPDLPIDGGRVEARVSSQAFDSSLADNVAVITIVRP